MLFGVLIIGLILYLFMRREGHFAHYSHGGCHHGGQGSDANEILRMRYAKGEITSEEFAEMNKNLLNS